MFKNIFAMVSFVFSGACRVYLEDDTATQPLEEQLDECQAEASASAESLSTCRDDLQAEEEASASEVASLQARVAELEGQVQQHMSAVDLFRGELESLRAVHAEGEVLYGFTIYHMRHLEFEVRYALMEEDVNNTSCAGRRDRLTDIWEPLEAEAMGICGVPVVFEEYLSDRGVTGDPLDDSACSGQMDNILRRMEVLALIVEDNWCQD